MNFKFILYGLLSLTHFTQGNTFLVFGGKTGWIGQKIVKILNKQDHLTICAESRLESRESIIKEIEKYNPDFIINAAGITGKPNVDWCEEHKQETIRANVLGALNLVDIANTYGIHVTNLSTGCIYNYDEQHPISSSIGFKEEEEPNFNESFYSKTKIILEKLILEYPNLLNLRIKMPISSDLHPRSFIGKITKYKKVINVPTSVSVLEDLLPIAIKMTLQKYTGNYNFVNTGTISHNEILELYKKYIDPNFTYENFSVEEQNKILKVGRAHCELDTNKLLKIFPEIPHIKKSITHVFEHVQKSMSQEQ